jgi:hypothetical protein
MHRVLAVLFVSSIAEPGFAQTILKHEPLYLAPYEMAYVYNASCGAGMVQKVTGSMRNLPRRKVCVPSRLERASLLGGERASLGSDRQLPFFALTDANNFTRKSERRAID